MRNYYNKYFYFIGFITKAVPGIKILLKKQQTCSFITVLLLVMQINLINVHAKDWPTYNHDNQRSGITSEHFSLPLHEQWIFQSNHKPAPAWPAPAPKDIWHRIPKLNPRATYDHAFHVAVAGDALYFGSSADDKIYSLDTKTGDVRWMYFTGGPVRLAPTVFDGKVYAGSDDGIVYCLDTSDGSPVWKYDPSLSSRKIPGNGRMISACPVRTGVLVEDGIVYFSAGLFPNEGVGMYALDARNGSVIWKSKPDNLSPQGYLLASKKRLFVPTGRTTPVAFDRENGQLAGIFTAPHGDGGTYALVTEDNLISGPGKKLVAFNAETRDQILTFAGKRIIVTKDTFYLLSDNELSAFNRTFLTIIRQKQSILQTEIQHLSDSLKVVERNRKALKNEDRKTTVNITNELTEKISRLNKKIKELKTSEHKWKTRTNTPYSMILAGNILFCGGDGFFSAFDTQSGKHLWTGKVSGRAYGLAAANGYIFVSTDTGSIHCFGELKVDRPRTVTLPVNKSPYRYDMLTDIYTSAAKEIVKKLDTTKGYCLVLDCRAGRLMYEIAKLTDMRIIGLEEDNRKVRVARKALDSAGLYGSRVSIHAGSVGDISFPDYFANLLVSDRTLETGELPGNPDKIYRMLRPCGGLVMIGMPGNSRRTLTAKNIQAWIDRTSVTEWKIIENNGLWITTERGPLTGSGEWTHQYAEPGNSSTSNDILVKHPLQIQWFGRPGPRHINDRHHRPMAPLYKDGRIFVIGNNYMIAADAYNGTILWEKEIPGSRRVGVIRDCGHAAAASDYVYITANDKCLGLDVKTGTTSLTFPVPQLIDEKIRDWGYVAYTDDLLFGSAAKETAARTEPSYNNILEGTYVDYRSIGESYVFFIESTNPAVFSDIDGRVLLTEALRKEYGLIVKLDKNTGVKIWERRIDLPYEHIIYLSIKDDILLVVGTYNRDNSLYYGLFGINAGTGTVEWKNEYKYGDTLNGDHGEQDQHPVIIGDTVYSRPFDFNLNSGLKGDFNLIRGGHGCGTISGSLNYLFGRGDNPRMYEIQARGETSIAMSRVNRPGCFINIIPAGGLILLPESSSGCTCPYPMQMSIAFAPVR